MKCHRLFRPNQFKFQSRNRESYLFKIGSGMQKMRGFYGFNLVIENLIFSSIFATFTVHDVMYPFQSRNRESYLFKFDRQPFQRRSQSHRFNLVIENLIFSSAPRPFGLRPISLVFRFNLVIENLIFSSTQAETPSPVRKIVSIS